MAVMTDRGEYISGLDPLPGGEVPRPAENPDNRFRNKSEMAPDPQSIPVNAPPPHETLSDEGGSPVSWLASAWSKQDIIEEHDWLELTPEKLHEIWMGCRWTTEEEQADDDALYDLFGDFDGVDTTVVYWRATPDTAGAHRYWTVEP